MKTEDIEYKGVAINPFDNWVFGSLLILRDSATEEIAYYIQSNNRRTEINGDSICRMVAKVNDVKFYDKDIIEYDYEGVRRIEPIIDTGLTVYVGRSQNDNAGDILFNSPLNIKVLGNTIENTELLDKKWGKI